MLAHDAERPPTYGVWFCKCHGCEVAATALAQTHPETDVVIKRNLGRTRITIGEWVASGHDADSFCEGTDDYVREVFVASPRTTVKPTLSPASRQMTRDTARRGGEQCR